MPRAARTARVYARSAVLCPTLPPYTICCTPACYADACVRGTVVGHGSGTCRTARCGVLRTGVLVPGARRGDDGSSRPGEGAAGTVLLSVLLLPPVHRPVPTRRNQAGVCWYYAGLVLSSDIAARLYSGEAGGDARGRGRAQRRQPRCQ
eukprot:3393074-Rhodomonas_salina.1